jgi:hypothetical protein
MLSTILKDTTSNKLSAFSTLSSFFPVKQFAQSPKVQTLVRAHSSQEKENNDSFIIKVSPKEHKVLG